MEGKSKTAGEDLSRLNAREVSYSFTTAVFNYHSKLLSTDTAFVSKGCEFRNFYDCITKRDAWEDKDTRKHHNLHMFLLISRAFQKSLYFKVFLHFWFGCLKQKNLSCNDQPEAKEKVLREGRQNLGSWENSALLRSMFLRQCHKVVPFCLTNTYLKYTI